jgi:hypothetical protein
MLSSFVFSLATATASDGRASGTVTFAEARKKGRIIIR